MREIRGYHILVGVIKVLYNPAEETSENNLGKTIVGAVNPYTMRILKEKKLRVSSVLNPDMSRVVNFCLLNPGLCKQRS
jgi:hypothetical protein